MRMRMRKIAENTFTGGRANQNTFTQALWTQTEK